MADSGIFGFSGGPTFLKQSDQDFYANMMAAPMSRTATLGSSFYGGVLKSDVLGSGIRDIFTPEGNVDLSQQTADIAQGKVGELWGQDIKIPVLGSLYGAAKAGVQAFVNDRNSPAMSEAQWKASPYFREAIPYDPAMTEQRAAALAMAYDRSQVREFFGAKRPVVSFLGNMAGQAFDPVNYIPIMGPAVKAAAAAKFGRIAGGMLVGSSDAAINTAIADISTREARGKYGDDISWNSIVNDVAVGALIGSAFGGVVGGVEMHLDAKRAKIAAAKAARLNAPGVVSVDEGAFVGADRGGDVTIPHDPFGPLRERIKSPADVGGDVTVYPHDIRDIKTGRMALNEGVSFGAHGEDINLSPTIVDSVKRMAAEGAAHADRVLPPTDIGRKVAASAHADGHLSIQQAANVGQLVESVLTSHSRRTGLTVDEVGALLPPLEFRGEGAAIPEGRMAAQEADPARAAREARHAAEFPQRNEYAVDTEDRGTLNVRVNRRADGSAVLLDDGGRAHELGASFAADKSDAELLAYSFSPAGFKSATPLAERTFEQSASSLQGMPADVTRAGPVAGAEGPLAVTGTGPGGRVVLTDLAQALTARHNERYGRRLDPNDPADYATVLQSLREDYANQKAQSDNGEAWYVEDINEAIRVTTQIIPELKEPQNRELFLTMAALLSPQQKPRQNWGNAILAMQGYLRDGAIPLRKPNGKQFGVEAHTTGLQLMQHLINTKGLEEALIWVRTPHTGREMAEVRRDSGLFVAKSSLAQYVPGETNLKDVKLGMAMFGPKVGEFAQNATGLDQNAVTVDLWAMRTYNRLIGRLLDVPAKIAAEGGLPDQPRGGERAMLTRLIREAAQEAGITPSAMQASLWYFEQRLYRNHGIRSDSQNFSGAARTAAEERGIVVDRQPDGGDTAGRDGDAGGGVAPGVRAGEGGEEVRIEGETDKVFAKRVVDKRPEPATLPENYSDYFIMDGAKVVPIDDLVSSKTAEENAQGGGNAAKRMEAAAKGELSKRPPITVERRADGKYLILDGNGTYTSVKGYGWKAMPVLVEGDAKTLFQPAYHGSGAKYEKIDPAFRGTGEGGAAFGEGFYATDIKGLGEHYRKIASRNAATELTYNGKTTGGTTGAYAISNAVEDVAKQKVPHKETGLPWANYNELTDALRRAVFHALSDDTSTNHAAKFDEEVRFYKEKSGVFTNERETFEKLVSAFREEVEKVDTKKPGALYKIDIPENHELMDWDKKLRDQPPDVLKKLQEINPRADLDETGESFYRFLARDMGWNLRGKEAEQAASDALRAAGIPGHRFLAGVDRKKGEGQHNYVIYDTDRIKILEREQPQRGSITFGSDKTIISLFKGADPSTALHETGHYFLELFKKLAEHANAPDELKGDWQAVQGWWHANAEAVAADSGHDGVTASDVRSVLEKGTSGDKSKDLAIDRGLHEQWARAFERYLREGTAPTKELRSIFEQFKQWLVDVYKKALDLNVELTPELRGVFDRMVGGEDVGGRLAPDDFLIPLVRSFDEIYAHAQKQQTQLENIGKRIAEETGVVFKGSPDSEPKTRSKAEGKIGIKGYQRPTQVTDIVRGGFVLDVPAMAGEVIDRLSQHFDILDEGWAVTKAGYFDRKVIIRFDDGMVGEVQFWEPHLLEAKEKGGGHKLYDEMQKHPEGSPEFERLKEEQKVLYGKAVSEAGTVWSEVAAMGKGSSPKVLNRSLQTSSVLRPAVDQTSGKLTSVQGAPGSSLAHARLRSSSMTAGRPSQFVNSSIRSSPSIDTTTARPDPIPAGRKEAEASLTKTDKAKEVADEYGIDLATGHADELDQIEELRAMGRLTPEDEAIMKGEDADMAIAEAYNTALKGALYCVV